MRYDINQLFDYLNYTKKIFLSQFTKIRHTASHSHGISWRLDVGQLDYDNFEFQFGFLTPFKSGLRWLRKWPEHKLGPNLAKAVNASFLALIELNYSQLSPIKQHKLQSIDSIRHVTTEK